MQVFVLLFCAGLAGEHAPRPVTKSLAIMHSSKAAQNDRDGKRIADLLLNGRRIDDLSTMELRILAIAYNWTNESAKQVAACDTALKHEPRNLEALESKANGLYNLEFRSRDKSKQIAFYDDCIQKKMPDLALWHLRKARALCQSSIRSTFNRGKIFTDVDRDGIDAAFASLKRAFEIDPNLLSNDKEAMLDNLWVAHNFPVLYREPRFQALVPPTAK
jgi:hypothetical protein